MQVTGYKARNIKEKWHALVYWNDDSGKRHQKSTRIHACDEREAEREALEFFVACKTGEVQLGNREDESTISYAKSYFKGRRYS